MVEKIDKDIMVDKEGVSPMGINYTVKRPLNTFESTVCDKINEIVDRFNEVFPI